MTQQLIYCKIGIKVYGPNLDQKILYQILVKTSILILTIVLIVIVSTLVIFHQKLIISLLQEIKIEKPSWE